MADPTRILAGTAGGIRYFYDKSGKLYNEAGIEQTGKFADLLKTQFPPPKPQPQVPNPANGRAPTPQPVIDPVQNITGTPFTPSSPQNAYQTNYNVTINGNNVTPNTAPAANTSPQTQDDDDEPVQPGNRPNVLGFLGGQILKTMFPELYAVSKKYRAIQKKKTRKPSKSGKKKSGKQNAEELSIKIEGVGNFVKTNGELLRQQLSKQEETITLLEKISKHSGGGGIGNALKDGLIGSAIFGWMKKLIIPVLGAVGLGALAAFAYHEYNKADSTVPNQDNVGADPPGKPDAGDRAKSVLDYLTPDPRKPKERAADLAKAYDKNGRYIGMPPGLGESDQSTPAIKAAENKKPNGKVMEIKADSINFEAKTIKLDAGTLTITSLNQSGGGTAVVGSGAASGSDAQQNSGGGTDGGGNAPPGGGNGGGSATSSGMQPAQSVFKPEVTVPTTPGSDVTGPVRGGQGAFEGFAGRGYDPRATGTAEAVRKNDISGTEHFTPTLDGEQQPGTVTRGASKQVSEVPFNGTQASIRYNNPGAAWPRAGDEKFGLMGYGHISGGNIIGRFPSPVNGMAANMDLLATSKKYLGQPIGAAISTWSNGGRNSVPGFNSNTIITPEMVKDPKFMYAFFNEMRKAEGSNSKMTEKQIHQAYDMYMAGGVDTYNQKVAKSSNIVTANANNTKNLTGGTLTSNMLSSGRITDMKSGIIKPAGVNTVPTTEPEESAPEASNFLKTKPDQGNLVRGDSMLGHLHDTPTNTADLPIPKYTDKLIEDKLNAEAGLRRYFGWKQGPEGRNRREQLSNDPWMTEPGFSAPLDNIKAAPPLPDINASIQQSIPDFDDPPEKIHGSSSPLNHPDFGAKPKSIRSVDIKKYYPQYHGSDFGDKNNAGISVV